MSDLTRMGFTALVTVALSFFAVYMRQEIEKEGEEWRDHSFGGSILLFILSMSFILIIWGDKL